MAKSTVTYWNTIAPESREKWRPIAGLEGVAEELTLSIDEVTGEYTRLTQFLPGADTTRFGGKTHAYPEEVFIVSGRLYDAAFDRWLECGHYASRPPGELHGPFKTDVGCLVLEVSFPNRIQAGPNQIRYFVVDAFTDRPFAGNPAAVVPLDRWREDAWLQNVAREMNLAETAYLVPNVQGFDLRWFTPKMEVDLCGHATLAAALVLVRLGQLSDGSDVAFSTRSGALRALRRGPRIELDFPAIPVEACGPPPGLLESLDVTARFTGRNKFDIFVEVESESAVRSISPDFRRLAAIECRGVIVTARSEDPQFDFVSRFFAPSAGIDEDPVTGSAHCCLAHYWCERLGKAKMVGYQASVRGGIVDVELRGGRVILGGEGIVFATGEIVAG